MSKRDALKEEAARSGDAIVYRKYQDLRNEITTLQKKAEANYYAEKFNDPSCSAKDMWKLTYQTLGKTRSDFPSQMMFGNKLLSQPIHIANSMNDFFLKKIEELKTHPFSKEDPNSELKDFLSNKRIPGFTLRKISEEEIKKLVKKMKGKRSCGLDWICGFSLKMAAPELIPEITALINISISSGTFYSKWKLSKVIPCYKQKGSKSDCKFYRPVSNLAELSKLQEKIVHNQVYDYFRINDLLHHSHHGFLQHHSTATALHQIVDTWVRAADSGKLSATLFLDLKAGFDVIEHKVLLLKLKEYGFTETTLSWFESYLVDRFQCVQIESVLSELRKVKWGIPQGSILGPLLFIIYINEVPEAVTKNEEEEEESNVVIYADDNSPTTMNEDPVELMKAIESDGKKKVTDWFSKNKMVCSGDKTKLLVSGTRANRQAKIRAQQEVEVCGDKVEESQSEKLLGLVVNNSVTWKNHLYGNDEEEGLLKNLSKRIGMLSKLRKHLPDNKFRQVMSGIFSSKLCYCITVWGGVWNLPGDMRDEPTRNMSISKEDMRKLQVMQNKCLRMLTNLDRDTPTATLLHRTKLMSVHQMVAHHTAVQVYNVYRNRAPHYHYQRMFSNLNETRTMGNRSTTNHSARVYFTGSLGRSSFFYRGSRIWSALPLNIKTAPTLQSFKSRCKRWTMANISIRP